VTERKNRCLLIALLIFLLIAASWPLRMMGPFGMGPWFMGRGRLGMPLFWIGGLRLVFWGVFVIVLLRLVGPRAAGSAHSIPESALDILKRRYAAGELTREQYEQMRKDVES
jgi:putative membrane protein